MSAALLPPVSIIFSTDSKLSETSESEPPLSASLSPPTALPDLTEDAKASSGLQTILNPEPVSLELPKDYYCSITSSLLKQQRLIEAQQQRLEQQEEGIKTQRQRLEQQEQEIAQLKQALGEKADASIVETWVNKQQEKAILKDQRKTLKATQKLEKEAQRKLDLEQQIQEESRRVASYALDQQKRASEAALREAKESKEVEILLKHVAQGKQNQAESLLKSNPSLTLRKGTVTDLSKRTFKNITAFQYALWALDWHMWKMLLNYMSPEAAAMQFQELEDKGLGIHGKHFSLTPLIQALNTYVQNYDAWYRARNCNAMETHWCQEVGGAQLSIPAHIAQEYCHPTRPFLPVPSFTEEVLVRTTKLHGDQGNWFTARVNGGGLGEEFGILRYNFAEAVGAVGAEHVLLCDVTTKGDAKALQSLWRVRQLQLEGLKAELLQSKAQAGVMAE